MAVGPKLDRYILWIVEEHGPTRVMMACFVIDRKAAVVETVLVHLLI